MNNSGSSNCQTLPAGVEHFHNDDDDMEATEASELVNNFKRVMQNVAAEASQVKEELHDNWEDNMNIYHRAFIVPIQELEPSPQSFISSSVLFLQTNFPALINIYLDNFTLLKQVFLTFFK